MLKDVNVVSICYPSLLGHRTVIDSIAARTRFFSFLFWDPVSIPGMVPGSRIWLHGR
jgi:hypothetical protein